MQLQAINEQESKVIIDIKDEFKISIRNNEEFATTYKNALGVKSVQETLLIKLESDFSKHRECIDFIDNLRK